jgi:hypothetical protein
LLQSSIRMVTNPTRGRPTKEPDWLAVNELILKGVKEVNHVAAALRLSPRALQDHCSKCWDMPFGAYARQVRANAQRPERPFSVTEVLALLSAYYSGDYAKTDGKIKRQRVKDIQYRPYESPSTGKSLFELVTYPQLYGVMQELRGHSVAIEGVSVRDGYDYILRVWVDPTKQATTLPPLWVWNDRPAKRCFELNPRGKALIKLALIAFEKVLYRRVLNA